MARVSNTNLLGFSVLWIIASFCAVEIFIIFCWVIFHAFLIFFIVSWRFPKLTLLSLSSWCLVIVVWLFLAVPQICLQSLIVVLPDHTHYFLSKISFRTPIECRTVWIQIRPAILSSLIWDQTVCKGYQQATKVAANM